MKPLSWLALFLMPVVFLVGCTPVGSMIQSTQGMQLPSPTISLAATAVIPTSTLTPAITKIETSIPTVTVSSPAAKLSPTTTLSPLNTLEPEKVSETLQPLIKDPLNCAAACYWGIIPGQTHLDEVEVFFDRLGFTPFKGKDPNSGRDFYTISNKPDSGNSTRVTLYTLNNLVENIVVTPTITIQKEGSTREWIAFSPETLIKKYGKPSRVEFGLDLGQENITINMIMYFDQIDLIALYSGVDNTFKFCPLTFPFNHVRLWMGANPPHPPQFPTVPLEKATSLTIDQFTQLMLGDPLNACFTLDEDAFLEK